MVCQELQVSGRFTPLGYLVLNTQVTLCGVKEGCNRGDARQLKAWINKAYIDRSSEDKLECHIRARRFS